TVANLVGANLNGADLSGANLSGANIASATLVGANLSGAIIDRAELSRADLKSAKLLGVNLSDTNLLGTCFLLAAVGGTIFGNTDLSKVVGLMDVSHYGPSHISTTTLALSKGKIPEIFLRGCGLSDVDIEYGNLYNPDLNNDEKTRVLYRIFDLRASQ